MKPITKKSALTHEEYLYWKDNIKPGDKVRFSVFFTDDPIMREVLSADKKNIWFETRSAITSIKWEDVVEILTIEKNPEEFL